MDTSSTASLLISGAYYILVGGLTLFSIFGVYILIRYGKSSLLSLVIALLYAFIYLKILAESYATLKGIIS